MHGEQLISREYFIRELITVYDKQEARSLAKISFEEVGISNTFQAPSEEQSRKLLFILSELKQNKPIQYILGKADFYDLILNVNPSVLIPRQETEELVDWIIKENEGRNLRIADFGTGSACIALALKNNLPQTEVYAYDVSSAAIETAKSNAAKLQLQIQINYFDILNSEINTLPNFDIIVSNPPYVTISESKKMHENVMQFEPHLALFVPEEEPLLFYKKIADIALQKLQPKGKLYFEINEKFGLQTVNLLEEMGFKNLQIRKDLNGKDRMIRADIN